MIWPWLDLILKMSLILGLWFDFDDELGLSLGLYKGLRLGFSEDLGFLV